MSLPVRTQWREDVTDELLAALRHTLLVVRTSLRARHPLIAEMRHPATPLDATDLIARIILGRADEVIDLVDEYHDAGWGETEKALPF